MSPSNQLGNVALSLPRQIFDSIKHGLIVEKIGFQSEKRFIISADHQISTHKFIVIFYYIMWNFFINKFLIKAVLVIYIYKIQRQRIK